MSLLFRLVLLVAGLVFAASLAVALLAVLALWGLRAIWAKLTGRPVVPFVMRIDPRGGFGRVYRPSASESRTPRADAIQPGHNIGDVTDVEPKP